MDRFPRYRVRLTQTDETGHVSATYTRRTAEEARALQQQLRAQVPGALVVVIDLEEPEEG